jgi:GTPase SAR1 family protein
LTATAATAGRARSQRRFSIACAELDLILESARALAAAERAADPDNRGLAHVAAELERAGSESGAQAFKVAVLALVKAGKSTLINALCGNDFLPTSNVPETARLVRVKHVPGAFDGTLRAGDQIVAQGAAEIRDYLHGLNSSARGGGHVPRDEALLLEASLSTLGEQPIGERGFELIDTPGPNEAGAEGLRALVDRALGDADVILYLLDYTKLRTVDERALLERLAALRPELQRRLSERLFFAVNKTDQANSNGLPLPQVRDYVIQLLRAALPELPVDPGRVLLISAEQALLARLVRAPAPAGGAVQDFARLCFGIRGQAQASLEDCRRQAGAVLQASGLVDLEEQVVSFLFDHRGELFLTGQLDTLERQLATLDNHFAAAQRVLQLEHGALIDRIAALEGELRDAEQAFTEVEEAARPLAARLEDWVTERFTRFRDELDADLTRAFGALGDGAHETADEALAQHRILDIQLGVAAALQSRFATFWSGLEVDAWERQRQMLADLQDRAAALDQRAGAGVGRRLGVALRPVRLQIPEPSFEDLHREIAERIDGLVERRTRQVSAREGRTARAGWCREGARRRQTTDTTRAVTVFACDDAGALDDWRRWIRERTALSIATARTVVRDQVGAAVDEARRLVSERWDGYRRTGQQALARSQHGELERKRRLDEVGRARDLLAELLLRIARCRDFVSDRVGPGR